MVDSKTYTYVSQFMQTGVKCATVHYKSSIAAASATVPDNLTFGDTRYRCNTTFEFRFCVTDLYSEFQPAGGTPLFSGSLKGGTNM